MAAGQDRRVRRTRSALLEAFNYLLLHRRRDRIRVSDIVARANVGRSTFYEHYASADDIHMEALSRPFAILAAAAAGEGDPERLKHLLDHFSENRQRARATFAGRTGEKAVRLLTGMVEARLSDRQLELALPRRLAALQLAEAALGPIRGWVGGEAPCTAARLAQSLCRCGEQLIQALAAAAEDAG